MSRTYPLREITPREDAPPADDERGRYVYLLRCLHPQLWDEFPSPVAAMSEAEKGLAAAAMRARLDIKELHDARDAAP